MTDKSINLDSMFRVVLDNHKKRLIQYIEAKHSEEAITKARNTFDARLYGLDEGLCCKETQKACPHVVIHDSLRFGFCGGWVTVHPKDKDTIYTLLARAEASSFVRLPITDITNAPICY